jgi:hypothetical protein
MRKPPLILLPTLILSLFALSGCPPARPRTAGNGEGPRDGASSRADPMAEEPVERLAARLNADDAKAPQARDALLGRWKRLTEAERAVAADAILGWIARDLPRRTEGGQSLLPQVIALVAPAASESTLAGLARAHAARLLLDGPPAPETLPGLLDPPPYGPHLSRELLAASLLAYDVNLPGERQRALLALVTGLARGPERQKASDVILQNLQVKEKLSPEAVVALGQLQAAGAVDFLRLFVQMDVPPATRRVCVEAIVAITGDPAAVDALYELAKPALLSIVAGEALKADLLERSHWALAGLAKPRACKLPASEYKFLRQVHRKKPADSLAPLRATALPALVRLMHCADPKKTRADVPAAERKAAGLE